VDSFADRVAAAVAATGPLCAGIDPSAELLAAWGLPDDAGGLRAFSDRCLEAFCGTAAVVKPQVAFYERHGAAGFSALEELLVAARRAGLMVIADAKRGDISTTAAAYAGAWLDPASPLVADAVTAVAYMGLGSLDPLIEAARAGGRGVLVVARGSNPEGRALQEAEVAGGGWVADHLLSEIAARNAGGARGAVGAVVGATLEPSAFALAELGGVLLAPGVGAQGGSAAAVGRLFAGCPAGSVLPNVSRSVLSAGPSVEGLRDACRRVRDELAAALG
jgi:orotidine-5'-phosphate decarboxylase